MALTQKLQLRQSQSLVMTPQLQQAIKMLQLTNLDLAQFIEQEVVQNPLLEAGEEAGANGAGGGGAGPEPGGGADVGPGGSDGLAAGAPMDGGTTQTGGAGDPPPGGRDSASPLFPQGGGGSWDSSSGGLGVDQTLSRAETLQDHVLEQLGVDVEDPVDRLVGVQLTDMLDEAGYLVGDIAGVAETVGCSLGRVQQTLAILQSFDPPGVFARDLAECLALQLRELDRLDPAMQEMLRNLDLLARNDAAALCRRCGVDAEDMAEMIAEIRVLNPKPGLAFGTEVVQTVVPDVYATARPEGGWTVELNSDTLPRVLVNMRYYARINAHSKTESDRAYLSERLNSANWLVKSLDQRANTILKVAAEIVAQQEGFLAHGVSRLRPLNLRDIATEIEMHESTVSRVTANKYMSTPRGIYPMKYFFTPAISSAVGSSTHSAESVRAHIRTLIGNESPDKVLSDDKIVELLRAKDIDIARRTVAKYRETMRIPSSVNRRRWKRSNC